MARIGVFGLNLSPRTGGIFSLIDGLMAQARHSRHEFLYLTPPRQPAAARLPENVQLLQKPAFRRITTQALLKLPGMGHLLRNPWTALPLLSAATGVRPSVFRRVDAWLWPHCFVPVPRLGRVMAISHDMIHRKHPECFSRLELLVRRQAERTLSGCAQVICPSEASARDLGNAYPTLRPRIGVFAGAPCEVMAESDCQEQLRQVDAEFGQIPFFLFVGVDWRHKNHQLLIDAALELRRLTSRPFKVIFVGRRRGEAIAEAIARKGAGDVVQDRGGVSGRMLAALYRRSQALVFPSLYEGFGIPLVEAMQYGLPIIASDCSCIPEVCGDAASLLPPENAASWAREMQRLLEDPDRRQALADRSGRRAAAFSWERTWGQIDEALDCTRRMVECESMQASPEPRIAPIRAR